MKKQFFRYLLKEFYVEKVDKRIWESLKNCNLKSNIIINTDVNFNLIKQIVTTLLFQNKENIEYHSTNLSGLIRSLYNQEGVISFNDLTFNKDYLIIYEMGDMKTKIDGEVLTTILSSRIMDNKYNLLILTSRKVEDLLNKQMLDNFKIVNFKNIIKEQDNGLY